MESTKAQRPAHERRDSGGPHATPTATPRSYSSDDAGQGQGLPARGMGAGGVGPEATGHAATHHGEYAHLERAITLEQLADLVAAQGHEWGVSGLCAALFKV